LPARRLGYRDARYSLTMYAKALIPSDSPALPATPFLFMTVAPGSVVPQQLVQRNGWSHYRGPIGIADGEVRILPDLVEVVIDGQIVLQDDTNPLSPDGWWKAVDALQGHLGLVLIPSGTPFEQPAFAEALNALEGSEDTAQAILRVVHTA
jgi:hypothetical protein